MKIMYKLTDSKMRTYKEFQWELGKWYKKTKEENLCSPDWLHFYSDPLVGLFLNPIQEDIKNPRLFRVEVKGKGLDNYGLNYEYFRARLIEELPVPRISFVQRVRFAILCAKEVYKEKEWNKWADNWLSGKDRTKKSAAIVACTIRIALSKTKSAYFAIKSAASTVKSTMIAFYAAKSVESAVESVARSTTKSKKIDLIKIARKAMKE